MKKQNPIKRNAAFVEFSKDHHFGLLLVWRIRRDLRRSVPKEQISNYVLEYCDKDLKVHFSEEEANIFSKLLPGEPLRQQAESEHRRIHNLIDSIRQERENGELLMEFAEVLEAHIRFEERTLFNYLQDEMTPAELEELLVHRNNNSNRKRSEIF